MLTFQRKQATIFHGEEKREGRREKIYLKTDQTKALQTTSKENEPTMENDSFHQNTLIQPLVCNDARFRAGRKLMELGQVHLGAIKIFSLLLDRAMEEFGESSTETAAVQYEYGYSMYLNVTREKANENNLDTKQHVSEIVGKEENDEEMSEEDTTIEIALEHMVLACQNLYKYVDEYENTEKGIKKSPQQDNIETMKNQSYVKWAMEQLPRMITGIGSILSYQGKHSDALNSYLNALPYRTKLLEHKTSKDETKITLDQLRAHRLLVDLYVLIVEEILKCPSNVDIKIPESNEILLKKEDRIKIAKGHYEKAREELQEV